MKGNLVKIFAVLLIAILCLTLVSGMVNAASKSGTTTSLNEAQDAHQYDDSKDTTGTASAVNKWLGQALVVVQVVGVGVAVIMLIVLAIKYISAAPSDKAEIKKHAVVYVVGAVVLFAASGILGLIRKFAVDINENMK